MITIKISHGGHGGRGGREPRNKPVARRLTCSHRATTVVLAVGVDCCVDAARSWRDVRFRSENEMILCVPNSNLTFRKPTSTHSHAQVYGRQNLNAHTLSSAAPTLFLFLSHTCMIESGKIFFKTPWLYRTLRVPTIHEIKKNISKALSYSYTKSSSHACAKRSRLTFTPSVRVAPPRDVWCRQKE